MLNGSLSGRTRLAAVIGSPIEHSLSPAIHNAAFGATGLDWAYLAFEVRAGRGAAALAAAWELGIMGLSVTMPLKGEIADACDHRSPTVERLGVANCVVRTSDGWEAHTTDGLGLIDDLQRRFDFQPAGANAVVVGAGGAARSVIDALAGAGCTVGILARRPEAAEEAVAATLAPGRRIAVVDQSAVGSADLVCNATPMGMDGHPGQPIDPDLVGTSALAVDLVYHPARTEWLVALDERGVRCANGVGMLVGQAARQFEMWTGRPAPVDAMTAAVLDNLDT